MDDQTYKKIMGLKPINNVEKLKKRRYYFKNLNLLYILYLFFIKLKGKIIVYTRTLITNPRIFYTNIYIIKMKGYH